LIPKKIKKRPEEDHPFSKKKNIMSDFGKRLAKIESILSTFVQQR